MSRVSASIEIGPRGLSQLMPFDVDLNLETHPPKHAHETEPRRVQTDAQDREAPARERGRTEEEGRGGRIPGDRSPESLVLERPLKGEVGPIRADRCPQGEEQPFRVIPRRDAFGDGGRPFCRECREEDGALHLRARDIGLESDPLEFRTQDPQRRMAILRGDIRTHDAERLRDPLHGPRRQARVAREHGVER